MPELHRRRVRRERSTRTTVQDLTIATDGGPTLPIDAVTETFAILGKRGKGKTSTAVVLAEELIRAGQPVIVLDTVGVWWGLRSSADGKGPGLAVTIFGGDHGDVPLEDTAGKVIADALMRLRVPAVLDLSRLSKAGMRRFAADFVEQLHRVNREPLHAVFDEADELAPQRPMPEGDVSSARWRTSCVADAPEVSAARS